MATAQTRPPRSDLNYPESDGKPVGETPQHRDNLMYLIEMLRIWFFNELMVYISGNMFLYYERGNRRRHVSPDVFVVKGIPREPERRVYLLWEEGKGPDFVIELTSASTQEEDLETKFNLYQDVLRVKEYFLFDPFAEYLDPRLQGYRLRKGRYVRIQPVDGRLPSQVVGLHLEPADWMLRLHDPATDRWIPTPREVHAASLTAEAEVERLRRELEALKRQRPRKR